MGRMQTPEKARTFDTCDTLIQRQLDDRERYLSSIRAGVGKRFDGLMRGALNFDRA